VGFSKPRLAHQLRRICERGLAKRLPSQDDGRATDATLTKACLEVIEAAARGHVALVRRLLVDPLPDELLASLTAALERVHVNINFNNFLPPARW